MLPVAAGSRRPATVRTVQITAMPSDPKAAVASPGKVTPTEFSSIKVMVATAKLAAPAMSACPPGRILRGWPPAAPGEAADQAVPAEHDQADKDEQDHEDGKRRQEEDPRQPQGGRRHVGKNGRGLVAAGLVGTDNGTHRPETGDRGFSRLGVSRPGRNQPTVSSERLLLPAPMAMKPLLPRAAMPE